jgi:HNH endonuclease
MSQYKIDHDARIAARLEKYIAKKGEDDCWEWTSVKNDSGYGLLCTHRSGHREYLRAHRVVWERAHGSIKGNLVVMHLCNNPACCNLKHLKLGSFKENNDQIHEQGRRPPFNSRGKYGESLTGVHFLKQRGKWRAIDNQNNMLYWGPDYFEACCARKSWEAKEQAKFGFVWAEGEWVPV